MKAVTISAALVLATFSASLAQAQTFTLVNADTNAANVGKFNSQAIVNGNPAVSYVNTTSGDLLYVRATDSSGTAWGTPVTVDSGGNGGDNTSLIVVNGNPAICYRDSSLSDVKYVRASNGDGTSWGAPVTVVSSGTVGLYSSMQVVNGNPAIAYYDSTSGNLLKFVKASDVNGASWGSPVTIDSAGGFYLSMNILPDGSPAVSYGSAANILKFVRAADATATSWYSPSNVDTAALTGNYTSLQMVNGRPAIAYMEYGSAFGYLKYVRSGDPNGLSWIGQTGVIVSNVVIANFGAYTSLQIISNKPAIAYQDGSAGAVKFVSSTNIDGIGTWTAVNVDSAAGLSGGFTSLQALTGSNPGISYQDGPNGNLKYAYVAVPAAPEIAVEQPTGTNIPDSGSKDFGGVAVGSNTNLTFTIKNIGTANLTGLTITKDGANSADFTVTASPTAPVAPAGSTTFTVQFTPGAAGSRTAALHIANNDSDESPFDITVTGTGTAPEIAVEQPVGTNIPDGGTKNSGSVAVGGNTNLTFTITNTGTANLTGLTITKDGVNSGDFTITASPTAPVAPGGSTTFTVQFAPGASGSRVAALHIANNDSDENPFDINLTGTGTVPEIAVEQPVGTNIPDGGTKDFGSVVVGGNNSLTFTITNTGTANLTGLTITKDGANSSDFTVTASPTAPVAPGGSTTFTVQFAPGATGSRVAALHIANNDSDENPFDINVTGTGTVPEIAVEQPVGTNIADGSSKDFGSMVVGGNTSLTFTITNTGTANLTGLTITKDGANSADFTVTVSPTAPVAPAGSTTFTVQFTPGATGSRTAALHIANNDSDENPFDINVTGTGTAPEIAVEQPAGSNIADGGTKDFGSVATGGDNNLTFTIKNTGTANLTGLTITKDGANSADFTVTVSPTAPVAPSGSTTFTVRFVPGGTGARAAALHIANNDSDENPFDINLTGTGTSTGTQGWTASSGGGNGASNGVADNLRIRLNGANVEFSADGGTTWTASSPLSTITNLTLTGSSDDDTFVIDLSGGNPIPSGGIVVNGGAQTSTGDKLTVTGGATTTVTHSFLNANDGSITLAGATAGTISYTGLEPITDSLTAADRVFTFGGGAETITLADAAGAAMTIDSTLSESVTFANPTASLTINAGTATDTVTITSVDANGPFNAALTINGDAGTDTVNLNGDITLAAGKNLVVSAETVTVGANADLTTSGAGTITINADSLAIDATATLNAGTVTLTPNTAGTAINLGGADAAGTLGLTDSELDRITAGTINIGDANSGDITVSAAISRAASTILNLNSGAAINLNASSLNSGGGNVTLNPATSVSPTATGTDVSMGTNGTLAFGSGDDLAIVINGATVDAQYRQLNVAGKVDLTGVDLVLSGSYTPVGGNSFTIVNNDGSDAIVGTFTGLPEGTNITFNSATLRLTYVGGDGNDVVLSVLSPPVVAADNAVIGVNEGNSVTNTGTFSDAEGNATVTLSASSGTVSQNNGAGTWAWTFNSTDGPDQSRTVTIQATDSLFTNTTTFALTVSNVAPTAGAQSLTTPEDTATNVILTASDPGTDTITNWTVTVSPTNGTLNGTAPNLTYSPNTNFHGADSFKFTATDSDGATSSEATVSLVATSVNDAPVPGPLTNYTVNPGAVISFNATATDADTSDVLSFSLVTPPANASITGSGAFLWRPRVAQADTTNTVTVVVTDNGSPNLSGTNLFTVIVNPLAPVVLTAIDYTNGQFTFGVSGTTGPDYIILASDDLMSWTNIATNLSPATPFQFTDATAGAFGMRSYRVRLAP